MLTPDDLVSKKGKKAHIPRDNVVFEIGLFMGAIGRGRTFIVHGEDDSIDLPSDLAGITTATFPSNIGDQIEMLKGVCMILENEIKKKGRREDPESSGLMSDLLGEWKCTWFRGMPNEEDYHSIKDKIFFTKVLEENLLATGVNNKDGNYELRGRITPSGVLTFYYKGDAQRQFSGGVIIMKLQTNSRKEMNGFWYQFDANREIYGGETVWKKA